MALKQAFREVRVVFETDSGNFSRTDTHIMNRITDVLAEVRNTNLAVGFYDEEGNRLRKSELYQECSPEMTKLVAFEFGPDEEARGA